MRLLGSVMYILASHTTLILESRSMLGHTLNIHCLTFTVKCVHTMVLNSNICAYRFHQDATKCSKIFATLFKAWSHMVSRKKIYLPY